MNKVECSAHGHPSGFHLSLDKKDIIYQEIDENIYVYKNLLKNVKHLEDLVNFSEQKSTGEFFFSKWLQWYKYGTYSDATNGQILWNLDILNQYSQNSIRLNSKDVFEKEYNLYLCLRQATSLALKHYVNLKNIYLPNNWFVSYPTLAKYYPGFSIDKYDHVMNFHTDYSIRDHWFSGEKFFLTCTTYINDDYDGGEICFLKNKKITQYKPEAGDIIVFPSGNPNQGINNLYYHGVKKVEKNYKILVRTYLKYISFDGNQEFELCQKTFGLNAWKKIYKNAAFINNLKYEDIVGKCYGIIDELLPEKFCKEFDVEMFKNFYDK